MKRYLKNIVVAGVSMVALSSCVGDLDTEPLTDQTLTPDKALAAEGAYDQQVAKIYASFAISGSEGPNQTDVVNNDAGEATFTRCYWNMQELTTDEARCAWSDEGLNGLQFQQWTATGKFFQLNFGRMTLINALCNEFLIQSEGKEQLRELRAEVRALRAFSYSVLLDLYRTAPWTDENTGIGAYFPEQADGEKLYSFVESELKEVMNDLPAKSAANYGKVNKYVAEMILANLYMNAEVYGMGAKYTEALAMLSDIINNGGYSLAPNYLDNFCYDNNESPEIILPFIFDMEHAQTYGGTDYLIAASCGSGLKSDELGLSNAAWAGLRAGEELVKRFSDGDKRARFWKTNESGARTAEIKIISDYNQGYPCTKWTNLKKDGTALEGQTFASTDYVFYRLADAYLLYVEAIKRGGSGGDAQKAVQLYNQIQQRAFGNSDHNINSLDDISMQELLDERSRELYFEGHRRTDLIRFNCYVDNYTWSWKGGAANGIQKVDSKYVLFPIPQNDIDANPNLKQTKGY